MTDTTPILGYDYATIDQIVRFADGHDLPPVLLLASGLQESQLNIWESTGDGGLSFGVFQIYTTVHGGPGALWLGYDGLARSMERMGVDLFQGGLPRWQWAFGEGGGWERWARDMVRMMHDVAPRMQGSIDWTMDQAHEQVSRASALYAIYQNRQRGEVAEPPPPSRERELLDAVTVSRDVWGEQAATLARLHAAALIRAENDAALVASFGEG